MHNDNGIIVIDCPLTDIIAGGAIPNMTKFCAFVSSTRQPLATDLQAWMGFLLKGTKETTGI